MAHPGSGTKYSKSKPKHTGKMRRGSKLQQIQECTRSSVSHLAEKLSPLTASTASPQQQLLRQMCSNFLSEHGCNVFHLLESKQSDNTNGIGEIGVSYIELKPETPPEHYTILSRSISGGSSGNLAKHGARKTYLFYRNVNENEKPITAIALVDTNNGEEPPLGFEIISQTPGANDANLTFKQKGDNAMHLCVYRGNGPPITRLGVVHIKKEQLPVAWHYISRTSSGKSPDIDSGHTIIAYQRNYIGIMNRFQKYAQRDNVSQQLLAQCLACLVCGIYSFDRQTFLHALEAFTVLEPIQEVPSGMLADFICIVRDSMTAYVSYFPREIYCKVLKWAFHVYDTRCNSRQIDTRAYINLLHLCMFLRYDDVRVEASMNIISKLMAQWIQHCNQMKEIRSNHKRNTYDTMRNIVCNLSKHVEIVKVTEDDITAFLNVQMVNEEFTQWVVQWMEELYAKNDDDTYYDTLISCTMIILAKICSQQLPLKLTAKSETIKRRIHGMKLLGVFLSSARHYIIDHDDTSWRSSISLILLRRVMFTAFIYNAITPIPALFKKMLGILKILWTSYRTYLKFEIGVLLDIGIIGLLQSKYCTSPQKIDLLRGLLEIFQNRGALINIFYNFDNDINHWPICSKLVLTLSKLTENGISDNIEDHSVIQHSLMLLSRFMQLIAKYLKAPYLSTGGNIDEQENFDTLGGGLEAMLDHIHSNKMQLKGLSGSNTLLSLYSGVSGISSSNPNIMDTASSNTTNNSAENSSKIEDTTSVSSFGSHKIATLPTVKEASPPMNKSNIDDDGEHKYDEEEDVIPFHVPTQPSILLDTASNDYGNDTASNDTMFMNRTRAFGRKNSAITRHSQHQEENMIIAKALKKARTEKLKTAIKFLVSHQHNEVYKKFSTLKYIAEFLYNNESLDKEEIGDFITALETKTLFSEEEHQELLMRYVGLLNFTGQSFDTAFRHFLTDAGFRLPKESQKIERLLIAFAKIFVQHNPHCFNGSDESALILAYGTLMLNTDLHNPRILDHTPMTKQQFYSNCSSGDAEFDKKLLYSVYNSIKENPIELDMMKIYDNDTNATKQKQNTMSLYKQKQFRKECATLLNKSLAKLRDYAAKKHLWHKARQREIVKTLYCVTWTQFLGSITTILQQTHDPSTQSICLDAIKYSCAAAICLHLNEPQLYAFLCDLAKFVFIEQNKHLIVNQRYLLTVGGEHLKQDWFVNIMNYGKTSNIKTGCQVVSHICNDMKCRVLYDANQKKLRDIEQELGASLHLVHPDRKFIFSGALTKQSTKGDLSCYRFYLFNDLLIYVSGSVGNYAVHRVLHLSLCKILDLRDGFIRNIKNAFRIVSPQKNILLIAQTSKEKHEWFQLLDNAISKQMEQRARWINENYQTLQEYHETARVSKYLGRNAKPKKHELNRIQNGKGIKNNKEIIISPDVQYEIKVFFDRSPPCKLCVRPFKRFTGKSKCPWCLDIICKKCAGKKTQLPDKNTITRVCDACYGAISYFVHEMKQTNNHHTLTAQTHDLSSMK